MSLIPSAINQPKEEAGRLWIRGLNAIKILSPMPMKQMVSRLLWALSLWKLMIVPIRAQNHTKMKSPHPQNPICRRAMSVKGE